MLIYEIPGIEKLELEHVVLDYNGTVAVDGVLIPGVREILNRLSEKVAVHVITADTFGSAAKSLENVKCRIHIKPEGDQDRAKFDYVVSLGAEKTAAIGNGRNDILMLEKARLGICVILREGAFSGALIKSDIVCRDIIDALSLFENPLRLKATLRF
jgi:soluble P-type ATPase